MAHVIGIPLRKGNNQEIISCEITANGTARADITEGMAVAIQSGSLKPVVTTLATLPSDFIGFIFDINPVTFQASLIRAADLVCLPSADASALSAGDALTVNSLTGLIDAAGDTVLNGIIADSATGVYPNFNTDGVNGKTGAAVADCVLASFGSGRSLAPVAPPAP